MQVNCKLGGEQIMDKEMSVNGKKYKIIKLLGKGKGGYSYLTDDGIKRYVLKQIHHEPCEYYQFGNKLEAEIRDYKRLSFISVDITSEPKTPRHRAKMDVKISSIILSTMTITLAEPSP